jgi:hypothetical protein
LPLAEADDSKADIYPPTQCTYITAKQPKVITNISEYYISAKNIQLRANNIYSITKKQTGYVNDIQKTK